MTDWRRLGLSGEAGRIVGFLAAVAVVSVVGLLLVSRPSPVQPAPAATATPGLGLTPAGAVPTYEERPVEAIGAAGPGWTDMVGLLLKLGLVLALLLLALRGLQRLSGRTVDGYGRQRSLEVLETMQLNQAVSLFLVGVGQRVFLLGGTTQQVGLLAELDDPAVLTRLRPARSRSTDFTDLLNEARAASAPSAPYRTQP